MKFDGITLDMTQGQIKRLGAGQRIQVFRQHKAYFVQPRGYQTRAEKRALRAVAKKPMSQIERLEAKLKKLKARNRAKSALICFCGRQCASLAGLAIHKQLKHEGRKSGFQLGRERVLQAARLEQPAVA